MTWLYAAFGLIGGAALAVQVGVNNGLRERMGHPVPAAITSFALGTLALVAYGLAVRSPWPSISASAAPAQAAGRWWIWLGGAVGACYIMTAVTFAPRLGASGWLAVVVTGQILASVALDHFGLVGFAVHPVSLRRVGGVVLLLAGAWVILKS